MKNSRSRLKQRRQVALEHIERYIKYYSNKPRTSLRGVELLGEKGEKYIQTRLEQLNKQKEVLVERIRNNVGKQ